MANGFEAATVALQEFGVKLDLYKAACANETQRSSEKEQADAQLSGASAEKATIKAAANAALVALLNALASEGINS